MTRTLKIPGLSTAMNTVVLHVLIVFGTAFGAQLVAGAAHVVSISTLLALITAAAAAGLTAIVHFGLGLIPAPVATPVKGVSLGVAGVSLKVQTRLYQFLVSVAVTFFSILGATLVSGAVHVTSLPSIVDLVTAAIAAAVAGIVQFVVGLIPAPAPVPVAPVTVPGSLTPTHPGLSK
ncbi:MAG: hypothetical protein JWO62_1153 [Acidimicrobiaceae bacterium]|nr:hypothetical protein [Acidimicrobiaceae bacterium]